MSLKTKRRPLDPTKEWLSQEDAVVQQIHRWTCIRRGRIVVDPVT
ncbi:hypothetical protein CFter6_0219 [Collimonas fungivorans]|uniref:Uncharacterized protein n=1 Tax=Collimonas fungivorans TaxID=158899 RepID=A0A127P545_9BURK|nr:hypothetical protein CFter6_0219 [Collimonas fungivorans]